MLELNLVGIGGLAVGLMGLLIAWKATRPRVALSTELIVTGPEWSRSGELQLTVHITNNSQHPLWAEAAYFGPRWGTGRERVTYLLNTSSNKAGEHSDRIKIEPFQSDFFMFIRSDLKRHPGLAAQGLEDANIAMADTLTIEAPLGVRHRISNADIRQFAKGKK